MRGSTPALDTTKTTSKHNAWQRHALSFCENFGKTPRGNGNAQRRLQARRRLKKIVQCPKEQRDADGDKDVVEAR